MSYRTMWRDETCCDFPSCDGDYNTANGARVAIVKDGKILAFCKKYSRQLIKEGVNLQTIAKIQKELNEPVEAHRRNEQIVREQAFIQSLK